MRATADLIVLATGNFDPAPLPGITKAASDSGLYHHNAWAAETYEGLHPDAPVALIGTGLTGVDVVLRLRELGHRGRIIALSRHGIFPNRHADYTPLHFQLQSHSIHRPPVSRISALCALQFVEVRSGEPRSIASVRRPTNCGSVCRSRKRSAFAATCSAGGRLYATAWRPRSPTSSNPSFGTALWRSAKAIWRPSMLLLQERALLFAHMMTVRASMQIESSTALDRA